MMPTVIPMGSSNWAVVMVLGGGAMHAGVANPTLLLQDAGHVVGLSPTLAAQNTPGGPPCRSALHTVEETPPSRLFQPSIHDPQQPISTPQPESGAPTAPPDGELAINLPPGPPIDSPTRHLDRLQALRHGELGASPVATTTRHIYAVPTPARMPRMTANAGRGGRGARASLGSPPTSTTPC